MTHIEILRVYPWKAVPLQIGYFKTERVALCPILEDGSVKCRIPAGINYMLRGVDKDGVAVATDNTVHPSFGGEETCHGCHDGHSHERQAILGKTPEQRFATKQAAGC
jgi:hypothetical protein